MNKSQQTFQSFRDKWHKNQKLVFDETLRAGSNIFSWILSRNGFSSSDEFAEYLTEKERILDAGCGNGRVTALLHMHAATNADLVGIDLASAGVARDNLRDFERVTIYSKDLLADLSNLGQFDFIYCQEVLHHTAHPQKAFGNLCSILKRDGEIAIYVYKKKAPIREYVDDFVRDRISAMSYEQAMEECRQITELGRVLAEKNIKIKVPAIDSLEIKQGEYDLQRFIYHFFMKCFWNPDLSREDNEAINYDWYHPQLCSKHTVDEIRHWFDDEHLEITHEFVDHYGITMRGRKL